MKRLALWRTTAVRFAALYTFIFGVMMAVGLGAVYLGTVGVIERQREVTITSEVRGLDERFRNGGLPQLVAAVQERAGPDAAGDNVYLVLGPSRQKLAGNLNGWPETADVEGWVTFRVTKRDGDDVAQSVVRARAFSLPGDFRLIVGRDNEDVEQFRALFLNAILWAALATVVCGGVTGMVLGSRVLRRVDEAAAAGERIAAGNLDSRVPVSGREDEFDRLAQSVNAMLDRIEGLMSGMRMATDSISHDVRKPLTRLRAKLDLALRRPETDPETQADIAVALQEIDRTVSILENLLRIAKAEAGVPAESWQPLDLAQAGAGAVELYHPVAEELGIELETHFETAELRGEQQLLAQAIANLIDNAIKYAPDQGAKVRVETGSNASGVFLSVTDNGQGIPEADRERVTERFVRLNDVARQSDGSGLGLSLVRAVARAHGGELVLGDAGPGLVARLEVPRNQASV